jgi:tetraacyldisaccharide 4'-kinase
MKAPTFWYHRSVLAFGLLPLSWFYWLGGKIRRAIATPYRAKIPVICVGNIVAGGAGKTPTALSLGHALQQGGAHPVFVTRGYGGTEQGPLRVDLTLHTAREVGDEALLLARIAPVWVGRDRAAAIRAAEPHGTHIIMDDGLQNPFVLPDLAFLVLDGESSFGNGFLIPAGPLRETFGDALKRVSAVILIGEQRDQAIAAVSQCPVMHARWEPNLPQDFPVPQKFFAFAGIGRPAKFYETAIKAGLNIVATQDFSDHYPYSDDDLAALEKKAATHNARLLTTEKDWVRLPDHVRRRVTAFPVKLVFKQPDQLARFLSPLR